MANTISDEARILTEAELSAVLPTHHPQLCTLPKEELTTLVRRLREYRDKARDVTHQRRRAHRGKAEPRGITPAPDEAGTSRKKQVFAAALKRLNRQIARLGRAESRPSLNDSARRALAMKRANQHRHHPGSGRTPGQGMRALPNDGDTAQVDPREIGRVSQFVRTAQVRRDR